MARLRSWARLAGAVWRLIRADALLPREFDSVLPGETRSLARTLRLFARRKSRVGRPGQRLAGVLQQLGPAAIKLGQLLSTRGDIFGAVFADDLSALKDRLPPFPTEVARAEVERALNRPIGDDFASFDDAVASASLAQAHRARLRDGREVAVKVLRPGVEARVASDIAALALAAGWIEDRIAASRRLEPRALAATIARALRLELDLRYEAAGADELREVMAHAGYMSAPAVVWTGVARRVLTLEWAAGAPLSAAETLAIPRLERPALANALVRGFLAQALDHGVFHADLHEGNLFVAPPARITAVDFGIVGRLDRPQRRYLAEILWGFLRRDYARVAAVHFDAGYVPAHHDRAAFAQALRAVGEPLFGRPVAEVSMGALLTQLFDITALFDMCLRPELVLLQKTMLTVEGVARRIDPHHDIWAAAEPVVRRWITRELAPGARLAQAARSALDRLAPAVVALAEPARPADEPSSSLAAFLLGALTAALAAAAVFALAFSHR